MKEKGEKEQSEKQVLHGHVAKEEKRVKTIFYSRVNERRRER